MEWLGQPKIFWATLEENITTTSFAQQIASALNKMLPSRSFTSVGHDEWMQIFSKSRIKRAYNLKMVYNFFMWKF